MKVHILFIQKHFALLNFFSERLKIEIFISFLCYLEAEVYNEIRHYCVDCACYSSREFIIIIIFFLKYLTKT